MKLEEKITQLRKKQGWSQEELAFRLDVSRQAVSKWEMGAALPEVDKIVKMSELFGCSTDYLLKDQESVSTGQVCNEAQHAQEQTVLKISKNKKQKTLGKLIEDLYWMIILVVFLVWSFATGDWGITWIIWPISGVSYSIIELIIRIVKTAKSAKKEKKE